MMGIVYEYGIGIRDIQPRFYYCCCNEHVIIALDKIEHHILHFLPLHLAVYNGRFYMRADSPDMILNLPDILNPVMDEEYLAIPGNLIFDAFLDDLFVIAIKLRYYGHPVRRRGIDYRQVPCAH